MNTLSTVRPGIGCFGCPSVIYDKFVAEFSMAIARINIGGDVDEGLAHISGRLEE